MERSLVRDKNKSKAAGVSRTDRFLLGALREFGSRGYRGTSVRQIAAASGVTKPAFYYYFGSKDSVYARLAKESSTIVMDEFRSCISGRSARERFLTLAAECADLHKEKRDHLRFFYFLLHDSGDGAPSVGVEKIFRSLRQLIRSRIVDHGISRGEISEGKQSDAEFVLFSLFYWCLNSSCNSNMKRFTRSSIDSAIGAVFV